MLWVCTFYIDKLSEIDECETMSNATNAHENGSLCSTYIMNRGRRESLMSGASLDEMYDTIPSQYISTLHGKRESDGFIQCSPPDELYNMMQLSAGERNRNMSISSEVHNAELMIR